MKEWLRRSWRRLAVVGGGALPQPLLQNWGFLILDFEVCVVKWGLLFCNCNRIFRSYINVVEMDIDLINTSTKLGEKHMAPFKFQGICPNLFRTG